MSKYRKLMESTREKRSMKMTGLAGDLDTVAREGARRMLVSVLEAEVTEFLGGGNAMSGKKCRQAIATGTANNVGLRWGPER